MTRHHPDAIPCGWRDDGVPEDDEFDVAAQSLARLPEADYRLPGVVQEVEGILDLLAARRMRR